MEKTKAFKKATGVIAMAITPQEVQKRTITSKRNLQELERRIDKALVEDFQDFGDREIWIDPSFFSEDHGTQDYLVKRYEAAGWNVRYESDQREGDAYVFNSRKT